eukprot:TRINITY_DN1091_c0_g1_i1.p1 TRINITY_DN1091_c0_g1~~TRINITY_DN1091_c0_g1_i1.p1  ORF type:complete len:573 (-),score=50.33 TRINITY_DN1091_c0_g1_i1:145-1863(-)
MMTTSALSNKGASGSYGAILPLNDGIAPKNNLVYICALICTVELCERIAFSSFNGTLSYFLQHLGYTLSQSSAINSTLVTLSMAWTILAAWTADKHFGRFWAIFIFALIYAVGSCCAAVASQPGEENRALYLFGLMGLVPLGTAGIKANISNFGADQFDPSTPEGKQGQERFFSWFYVSINVGACFTYAFLTTLATSGGPGVPKEYGFFTVYSIAAGCMVLSVFLFSVGHKHYKIRGCMRTSPLEVCARYLSSAACNGSAKGVGALIGIVLVVAGIICSVGAALLYWTPFVRLLTYAAAAACGIGIFLMIGCNIRPDWVDSANLPGVDIPAHEVSDFFRLIPVLLTGQLAFGAVYSSMSFWFQLQACQMDTRIVPGESKQFAGSFFNLADCISIIVCTPLIVGFLNPKIEEHIVGTKLSVASKFMIGIGVGIMSVVMAIFLEFKRRTSESTGIISNCAPGGVEMSSLSAAWMIGPYAMMGVTEVYTQPAIMYFAYTQSPVSMRTLSAIISLFMKGATAALFAIISIFLKVFLPDDLNKGHIEYGYVVNIVFTCFFSWLFSLMMQRFQWRSLD